jgi:thiol:disulfide interchange protein DsbA
MNRRTWLGLAAFTLSTFVAAGASAQVPGKDYNALSPPQPVSAHGVEVIEFFSFACPHCMQLEPLLQKWRATLPKDVSFHRVPVGFGRPDWSALARMYITLGAIGMGGKLDDKVFAAIHTEHVNLGDEKTRSQWLARQGVDLKKYEDASRSFGVEALAKRADELTHAYKVTSVPSLYVDGRFEVQGTSHEELLKNVDLLIAKARAEKAKK